MKKTGTRFRIAACLLPGRDRPPHDGRGARLALAALLVGTDHADNTFKVIHRCGLDGDLALVAAEVDLDTGVEAIRERIGKVVERRCMRLGRRVGAAFFTGPSARASETS